MATKKRRKKKSNQNRSALRLIVILAVVLTVTLGVLWMMRQGPDAGHDTDFGESLGELAVLRAADVIAGDDPIRKIDGVFHRSWRFRTLSSEAGSMLFDDIKSAAAILGGEIVEDVKGDAGRFALIVRFEIEVFEIDISAVSPAPDALPTAAPTSTPKPSPTPRPTPKPGARGKLAIILDDGGQSMALVPLVTSMRQELAVSILPFLPHSAETATALHKTGHEVWLHLPLEPTGYPQNNPGPGAIFVDMEESDIRQKTRTALNNVPFVVGVNHHMGSRASSELRVMTWIMQELSARGIVYVDSRTSAQTVAEDAARAQGVAAGRRHVFLDNERSPSAIRAALDDAVYRSRTEGKIIAIGHLVDVTVETLIRELPGLEKRGVDLVAPSKLVD